MMYQLILNWLAKLMLALISKLVSTVKVLVPMIVVRVLEIKELTLVLELFLLT